MRRLSAVRSAGERSNAFDGEKHSDRRRACSAVHRILSSRAGLAVPLLLALISTPKPAHAAESFPITRILPADGSVRPVSDFRYADVGFRFLLQSPLRSLDQVHVSVGSSPELGTDGLLEDTFMAYRMLEWGNSGLYENEWADGPTSLDGWSNAPGTHYWQAVGREYGEDARLTVEYVSDVFSVTLESGHFLVLEDAKAYVRRTLRARFGASYRQATDKRVNGCSRRSDRRIRCRVSWTKGRYAFVGNVTVWSIPGAAESPRWSSSYRIRRYDSNCTRRDPGPEGGGEGRSCVKIYGGEQR